MFYRKNSALAGPILFQFGVCLGTPHPLPSHKRGAIASGPLYVRTTHPSRLFVYQKLFIFFVLYSLYFVLGMYV